MDEIKENVLKKGSLIGSSPQFRVLSPSTQPDFSIKSV
jgi:hypothetical protein